MSARAEYYADWKANKLQEDPGYFRRIAAKHRKKQLAEDPDGFRSSACARVKRYYQHQKARIRENERKRRADNPQVYKKKDFTTNIARFGFTEDSFFELYHAQNESCAICGLHNDDSKYVRNLHIDHCHETGLVRGLLCHGCNTGLGAFSDDVKLLEEAVKYLKSKEE